MENIQTIEQQIIAEYGVVKGWVATHSWTAMTTALTVGFAIGKFWEWLRVTF